METRTGWALILGASSGFGAATCRELAKAGYDIFGVHLDRKSTLPNAQKVVEDIEAEGRTAHFFNVNAGDAEARGHVLEAVREEIPESEHVRVVLHSLAFGSVRPFVDKEPTDEITQAQMEMTLHVMAHSLVYWVQDMNRLGLLGPESRVLAMTSTGGRKAWTSYGAVSAAKAALEAHIRQLAVEMAPIGTTFNAVRAGVTDTPALRKIPSHERMINASLSNNPFGRLTRPEDVAKAIVALVSEGTYWMTGNVIGVDGGEDITA